MATAVSFKPVVGVKIADPTNIRRHTVAYFSNQTDAFNYFIHLCVTSDPDVGARHVLIDTNGLPVSGSEKLRTIAACKRKEMLAGGHDDGATRIG